MLSLCKSVASFCDLHNAIYYISQTMLAVSQCETFQLAHKLLPVLPIARFYVMKDVELANQTCICINKISSGVRNLFPKKTRNLFVKRLIWNISPYCSDTYNLRKLISNCLNSLGMWCWRWALKTVGERNTLFKTNAKNLPSVVGHMATPVKLVHHSDVELKWLPSELEENANRLISGFRRHKRSNNCYTDGIRNIRSITFTFASVPGFFGKHLLQYCTTKNGVRWWGRNLWLWAPMTTD